ncbi:MAG: hypothetical protein WC284_06385 [Candidimonas sp.]
MLRMVHLSDLPYWIGRGLLVPPLDVRTIDGLWGEVNGPGDLAGEAVVGFRNSIYGWNGYGLAAVGQLNGLLDIWYRRAVAGDPITRSQAVEEVVRCLSSPSLKESHDLLYEWMACRLVSDMIAAGRVVDLSGAFDGGVGRHALSGTLFDPFGRPRPWADEFLSYWSECV